MILAAGVGSRLAPLTDTIPKPLIEVNGKPLIAYHLENLEKSGFKRVVVNAAYKSQLLKDYLDTYESTLEIIISDESHLNLKLETGGGIIYALDKIDRECFFLINSDVFVFESFADLIQNQQLTTQEFTTNTPPNYYAHLFLTPNPQHNPDGDFSLTQDNLIRQKQMQKHLNTHLNTNLSNPSYTFSGLSVLNAKIFTSFIKSKPYSINLASVIKENIAQERIKGSVLDSFWIDVGTTQRLDNLKSLLKTI